MSKEKAKGFMAALDEWTDANIVTPLYEADPYEPDNLAGGQISEFQTAVKVVKNAIWQKVLESYHNGQLAASRAQKGGRHGS